MPRRVDLGHRWSKKDAIVGYASRHNLDIIEWFEEKETAAKRARRRLGLDAIRQHCIQELEARLELPARTDDDWSIDLPGDCQCDLCTTLGTFLRDPTKQQLDWPIAQKKRLHVHHRLDSHELPVEHTTRRTGSPYTLMLSKMTALFEREARDRRSWQTDLDWLTKTRKRFPRDSTGSS